DLRGPGLRARLGGEPGPGGAVGEPARGLAAPELGPPLATIPGPSGARRPGRRAAPRRHDLHRHDHRRPRQPDPAADATHPPGRGALVLLLAAPCARASAADGRPGSPGRSGTSPRATQAQPMTTAISVNVNSAMML